MTTADIKEQEALLLAAKNRLAEQIIEMRNKMLIVPLRFHLVGEDDGDNRVNEARLLDQFCQLNDDFKVQDIQFYLEEFNYINNSEAYQEHLKALNLFENERDNSAVNIFVVKDADHQGTLEGAKTFGYYDLRRDWLIIRKDEINGNSIVLTHELGHFFGLLHPYNGWDTEPWEIKTHGSPTQKQSPRGIPTELVDGSNCEESGDFLCDTPPDYFFAFRWNNCQYDGKTQDPNGMSVDPEELDFMANFLQGCDRAAYFFSEMQQEVVAENLSSERRAYINLKNEPTLESQSFNQITTQFPANQYEVATYNYVELSWNAASPVAQYLVEIDRLPTFNINPIRTITSDTILLLNNLEADKKYYWRVRPYSQYQTCTDFTSAISFTTGNLRDTSTLAFIEDLKIYPNPIQRNQNINIQITTSRNFPISVHLFDNIGRMIESRKYDISPLANRLSIATDRLSSGLYHLTIATSEGEQRRKILVLD